MKPYGRQERRGIVILVAIVLAITAFGIWYKGHVREALPSVETVTVYRTVTDTVYRTRRKPAKKKSRKSHRERGKNRSRKADKPRDLRAEPIPVVNHEEESPAPANSE